MIEKYPKECYDKFIMDINKKEEHFDVAVVGGGAAGMMAAISASFKGLSVVLVEKNQSLGKKLLLTGNGRCNITQAEYSQSEFIQKLGKNGRFLFSSLTAFGPEETMQFFENLGLKVKVEKDGRVFPASNRAEDALKILKKALENNRVEIRLNQNVLGLKIKNKKIEYIKLSNKKIYAGSFIISTGGKSYPATGSTGDGYAWLEEIGHKVNCPAPALVPVKIKEAYIAELKGISLKNIGLNLAHDNQRIKLGAGEIIFTHFGLSGPVVINASKIIGEYLRKGRVFLEINLIPDLNTAELEEKFKKDFEIYKKINLKNYLSKYFPKKLAEVLIKISSIELDKKICSLNKSERNNLASLMKGFRLTVESLLDFNQAMITSGGASLRKVDPRTMRSKIINNLFLAGEILDLDGPTGGYNLQIAWTTGYTAGINAGSKKDPVSGKIRPY
jgi:predicted Rossmann fold flavoprotein